MLASVGKGEAGVVVGGVKRKRPAPRFRVSGWQGRRPTESHHRRTRSVITMSIARGTVRVLDSAPPAALVAVAFSCRVWCRLPWRAQCAGLEVGL